VYTATRVFESSLGNLSTCSLLERDPSCLVDGWMDEEEEEEGKSFLLAGGEIRAS
jgi:hypothetical protein